MIQFAIYDGPGGQIIADYTHKASGVRVGANERGDAEGQAFVPLSLPESFRWHDRPGLPHVLLTDNGFTVYAGRLEDPGFNGEGLRIAALGYSRAMSDVTYTALWSDSKLDRWRVLNRDIFGTTAQAEKFEQDNNEGRLYMSPKKNETFGNAPAVLGFWGYIIPDRSTRKIVGIQYDYDFLAPTSWRVLVQSRDGNWGAASATLQTLNGSGAQQTGSIDLPISATDRLTVRMDFNAANAAFLGDTGSAYLRLTNMRLVTSTANRVNTTFTNATGAGAATVTPASMVGIYVGQRLFISVGGAIAESVIVTAITSTTFNATFVFAHAIGNTIQSQVVYADEIAADMAAAANTANPAQLSSSTALIQSPGLDLLDEQYEDVYPAEIMDYLANRGDTQSPPRRWEWSVDSGQRLIFQPRGNGRTWYVDVTDMDVIRTLEEVYNSGYSTYQDANDRTLRTTTNTDAFSVAKYGVTRRQALKSSTTLVQGAEIHRDAAIADQKDPAPRAGIAFDAVYDEAGQRRLLYEVRPGDTMVIRNLQPTLSSSIDRIRSFRITRTTIDLDAYVLVVEPEAPLPTLEAELARP